jgi:hypothetical protein
VVVSLGGRVVDACIDEVSGERGWRAHLSLASGSRQVQLEAGAGEAVGLALQAGARIVADPAVLDAAGVSPEDLRGMAARGRSHSRTPAPVTSI